MSIVKKETPKQVFAGEFREIFKNNRFTEHLPDDCFWVPPTERLYIAAKWTISIRFIWQHYFKNKLKVLPKGAS